MTESSKATRERILVAAYGQFYRSGFMRVSMDAIAKAAGVTKRSVYYHFESKDALAHAALENQQRQALDLVRSWGNAPASSAEEFVTLLFGNLDRWSRRRGWTGSGYTRLTYELADLPGHPVRHASSAHKKSVERWLSGKLSELGCKDADRAAGEIMILIEGTMSLILIHGPSDYATIAAGAASAIVQHRSA
jgi:AcrR family transcriptional regulator